MKKSQIIVLSNGSLLSNTVLAEFHKQNTFPALIIHESPQESILKRLKHRIKKYGISATSIWFYESLSHRLKQSSQYNYSVPPENIIEVSSLNSPKLIDVLASMSPCLVINTTSSIIPVAILDIPQVTFFSVHPGLLPKYVGLSSIHWQVYDGQIPGFTIFQLTKKMDKGPAFMKTSVLPRDNESFNHYTYRFNKISGQSLAQYIISFCKETLPTPLPPESTKPINRGLIPWSAKQKLKQNWKKLNTYQLKDHSFCTN